MTRLPYAPLALAALLLAGASGCKRRNPMPTPSEENAFPAPAAPLPATAPPGNSPMPNLNIPSNAGSAPNTGQPAPNAEISVSLKADKTVVRAGESVNFTITARNAGAQAKEVTFNSGQSFDVVVRPLNAPDDRAQEVWRWSTGRMFTMALRTVSLEAGQELTWTAPWQYTAETARRTPRGVYEAQAELAIIPKRFSSPIRIELVP